MDNMMSCELDRLMIKRYQHLIQRIALTDSICRVTNNDIPQYYTELRHLTQYIELQTMTYPSTELRHLNLPTTLRL